MKKQDKKKAKSKYEKPLKLKGKFEDFMKAAMGKEVTPPKKIKPS